MEHLSLRDDHLYRRNPLKFRTRQPAYHPPRLPTPEPSRSSLEATEIESPPEPMKRDADTDVPSLPRSDSQHAPPASRRRTTPHSPPYEAAEAAKPVLPPLKTILGENISSPPRTPRIRSAYTQPAPQEPIYTTDTYKPPSLYPNKKQKTQSLQPVPPFAPISFAPPHSTVFESPVRTTLPATTSYSTTHAQYNPSHTPRPSNHRPEPLYPAQSPSQPYHQSLPNGYTQPATSTSIPRPDQQYVATEPMQRPPRSANSIHSVFYSGNEERPRSSKVRRFSASACDDPYRHPYEDQRARHETRYGHDQYRSPIDEHPLRHGISGQPQRVGHEQFMPAPGPPQSAFQGVQQVESFAPGPYEYYYTKARKRSNLPKHSTEIMRAWFDQNISNPYPSEDQKAIFANATGISLTQVSNWFINHRRRCPELRDKRVERRKP